MLICFNHETPLYYLTVKNDEVNAERVYRKLYVGNEVKEVMEYYRNANKNNS